MRRKRGSKDEVLEALGELKEPSIDPYYLYSYVEHQHYPNPTEKFIDSLQKAGGRVFFHRPANIQSIFKDAKITLDLTSDNRVGLTNLQKVDLTILKAEFGVAENGAVWINWNDEAHPRALLTISRYLAIYLERDKIFNNMAEAYSSLDFSNISYGIFLSGPSKTADIEQSLVIGAHGATDLVLFLI